MPDEKPSAEQKPPPPKEVTIPISKSGITTHGENKKDVIRITGSFDKPLKKND